MELFFDKDIDKLRTRLELYGAIVRGELWSKEDNIEFELFIHCCGNILSIMKDLIEEVKIDAFHSFQDNIIPVGEFKKKIWRKDSCLGGSGYR